MALFTDGPVSTIQELTARDSQLLTVANVEGIDVTQKIALAQDEIALELGILLSRMSFVEQPIWATGQSTLSGVVVTPALKLWHTLRALELVYRDAFNSELNDRYAGKRDQFHEMAEWAHDKLVQIGIGIVLVPVPRSATPVVTVVSALADGPLPDGTYYVATSWTNVQGEEGVSAVPVVLTLAASTLEVQPGAAPTNASGWNVYIGMTSDTLALQNNAPLTPDAAWVQPGLLAIGRQPGSGQSASLINPMARVIQRG